MNINSLIDTPSFSDEYIDKIINDRRHNNGFKTSYRGYELLDLNDVFRNYYILDLVNQDEESKTINYTYLLKRLIDPTKWLIFKNDEISVNWPDKNVGYKLKVDKATGNGPLFSDEVLGLNNLRSYNVQINIINHFNLVDSLYKDAPFIYKLIVREIYTKYIRNNGSKRRSKDDISYHLKKITAEEVVNILIIAYPNSEIENHGKDFLRDYSLDHLLEIYRKLS